MCVLQVAEYVLMLQELRKDYLAEKTSFEQHCRTRRKGPPTRYKDK